MSNLRQQFEKELKTKLSLKTSKFQSEETIILKAFKYFDLDNSGECDKDEFTKALQKIGISGLSPENIEELFNAYDENGNGSLDYKEFVNQLFGNEKDSSNSPSKKKEPEEKVAKSGGKTKKDFLKGEGMDKILDKIREKLGARGIRGIISIARAFKIMDDDRSGYLDMSEFRKASNDYRLDLNPIEVEKAFKAFDRNDDGEINYDEFIRLIRGDMNQFRVKLCLQAFNKMDRDGSGEIDINDIRGVYNAKFHPDVKSGKKTEEEILLEFLETFEQHHNNFAGESADHIITKEEWLEYYANVSMSIDDDKYFELMINNAWRMNDNTTYNNEKKGWADDTKGSVQQAKKKDNKTTAKSSSNNEVKEKSNGNKKAAVSNDDEESTENPVLIKFREKLFARGGKGIIGMARQFKIFDDDNSKSLSQDEFTKAVKDFRVELNSNEIKVLFNIFDRDGSGSIDYDEFLRYVKGEMPARRKRIVMQAFDKLDLDKSGVIDINEIKSLYNCKMHPDVKSGKKTEDEVYGEFIETFEMHHNINKGGKDRRITKEEFTEYYTNISCSIDSDEYFDLMMTNAWKLGKQDANAGKAAWAGEVAGSRKGGPVAKSNRGDKFVKTSPFGVSDEPIDYGNSSKSRGGNDTKTKPGTVEDSIAKFRNKLAQRGARGIMGLRRSFNICDDDGSKTIDVNEFIKICKDYRIGLEDNEIKAMFKAFDSDGTGSIDYDEFLRAAVGEMNNFRKGLIKKVFNKLDKNGNGSIEVDDLKGVYNASKHPDVKSGKKTEDEILGEFLDTFEYHFSLTNQGSSKNRSISLEEFIEYYNNISMSIDDDKYFDQMINTCWNLDGGKQSAKKGWKGEI